MKQLNKVMRNFDLNRSKREMPLRETRVTLENKKLALNNNLVDTEDRLKRTSDMISKFSFSKPSIENETDDLTPDKETEIQQEKDTSKTSFLIFGETKTESETLSLTEGLNTGK